MPRVRQSHLDARRQQVLDAARLCFIRQGFHRTSMQDIFREAGLSAGAVYRYFPGKEDIVAAISRQAFDSLSSIAEADDGEATPSPVAMVLHLLDRIDHLEREGGMPSIALQVWSEAASVPRLADLFDQRVAGFADRLSVVIDRQREEGYDLGEGSSTSVALVILGLLEGYIVQRAVLGERAANRYREGVRALLPDVLARSTRNDGMPPALGDSLPALPGFG